MSDIPIEKAKTGMVLKRAAKDFLGRCILESGSVLTNENLVKLRQWGIENLVVEGESSDAGENNTQQKIDDLNKQLLRLSDLFTSNHDNRLMQCFFLAEKKLLQQKLERLS